MAANNSCDVGGCIHDALYVVEEKLGGATVYKSLCAKHWLAHSS